MRKVFPIILFLLALCCAHSQTDQLRGVVFDKALLEPVPFANVVVKNGFKVQRRTQTDFDGVFVIKDLPQGEYEFVCTCPSYDRLNMNLRHNGTFTFDTVWLQTSSVTLGGYKGFLDQQQLNAMAKDKRYKELSAYYYSEYLETRKGQSQNQLLAKSIADSALKYLTICLDQDKKHSGYLYYPIVQIERFLGLAHNHKVALPRKISPYGYILPHFTKCGEFAWADSSFNLLDSLEFCLAEDEFYGPHLSSLGVKPFVPADGDAIVFVNSDPFEGYELMGYYKGQIISKKWNFSGTVQKVAFPLTFAQRDSVQALLAAVSGLPSGKLMTPHWGCVDGPTNRVLVYIEGQQQFAMASGCARDGAHYCPEVKALRNYLSQLEESQYCQLTIVTSVSKPSRDIWGRFRLKHLGSDFYFNCPSCWVGDTSYIDVPAGKYRYSARVPGYWPWRAKLHVSGDDTQINVRLKPLPLFSTSGATRNREK